MVLVERGDDSYSSSTNAVLEDNLSSSSSPAIHKAVSFPTQNSAVSLQDDAFAVSDFELDYNGGYVIAACSMVPARWLPREVVDRRARVMVLVPGGVTLHQMADSSAQWRSDGVVRYTCR